MYILLKSYKYLLIKCWKILLILLIYIQKILKKYKSQEMLFLYKLF